MRQDVESAIRAALAGGEGGNGVTVQFIDVTGSGNVVVGSLSPESSVNLEGGACKTGATSESVQRSGLARAK